jgi:ATP-dependent RNA helicase DDX54/DBP10
MGFQEQLNEIIHKLPETRQTLLFSATLPKLLVEFAKAGLHDPTLIRLDVETKISENLKVSLSIYSNYIIIEGAFVAVIMW